MGHFAHIHQEYQADYQEEQNRADTPHESRNVLMQRRQNHDFDTNCACGIAVCQTRAAPQMLRYVQPQKGNRRIQIPFSGGSKLAGH